MYGHPTFMDLRGIRIDDERIEARGGRIALTDIRAFFVVDEPPDLLFATTTGTGTASAVMAIMILATAPLWSAGIAAALVALAVTTAVACLRPRRLTLWASCVECGDMLIESGIEVLVNQVCRALLRAYECSGDRRPGIYRVAARHYRRLRLGSGVAAFAAARLVARPAPDRFSVWVGGQG